MINFKIKDDQFFTIEKSYGNQEFPRRFYAQKIDDRSLEILAEGSENHLYTILQLKDFTIGGVAFTNVFNAVNELSKITWNTANAPAPATDYTPLLQTLINQTDTLETSNDAIVVNTQEIEDKIEELKPLLIEIDNNTDTLETSNDAIVVNTQQIEDKLDLLKPAFEIAIELVDGANGSNVGVDFTYTIPQAIHQMSIVSEVKIGTATSIGSISANYEYSAGVLKVFSVGTMNGQYIWIAGTKI